MSDKSFDDRLEEILHLPPNWNGYGAGPVSPQVAEQAKAIWAALAPVLITPPQLVPGDDGSLQMEWHENGFDIEINIMKYFRIPQKGFFVIPQKGPTDD